MGFNLGTARARLVRVFSWLAACGCGPTVPSATTGAEGSTTLTDASTTAASDPSADATSSVDATISSSVTSPSSSTASTGNASSETSDERGQTFIDLPDVGDGILECDIWVDDCPVGQKCMPWANDGGNRWNALRCTPIAPNPNGVGEPCTVEGSPTSGIDDCVAHSMCWDVEPDTNIGTCVAFCSGSPASPTCAHPCEDCVIANDDVLVLCLPQCDPLLQNCAAGRKCFPSEGAFVCGPDSGHRGGALGDPCEVESICDPGLFCASPELVPGCASRDGCCAAFCDTSADDPCPGAAPDVECVPWFEPGEAPPCLRAQLGACVLAQ